MKKVYLHNLIYQTQTTMFEHISKHQEEVFLRKCSGVYWMNFKPSGNEVKQFGRGGSSIFLCWGGRGWLFFLCWGGGKGVGCYLGVVESMKHASRMFQFENWNQERKLY